MAYSVNKQIGGESGAIHPFRRLKSFLWAFRHKFTSRIVGFRVPFSERRILLAIVDSIVVLLAVWGAHLVENFTITQQIMFVSAHEIWQWFPPFLAGWWILASLHDLYDIPSSYHLTATTMRLLSVGTIGILVCLLVGASVTYFVFWLVLALPALILWRGVYVSLSRVISAPRRIVIFGFEKRAQVIAQLLSQTPRDNQVLGYIDDRPVDGDAQMSSLTVLGHTTDLPDLVRDLKVDEVVMADSKSVTENIFQLLMSCRAQGAKVSRMSDIYERLFRRIPVQYIDPTWALYAIEGQSIFNRWQRLSKRALDLAIVLLSLPVFGLLLPLLALAIRIDSAGPVFYRQVRSGRGGTPFAIFKFRTMFTDAEKDGKARWATENDPRITRVGRFLRKTRLDELPQIFNILKGDMSVVGPRPERPEFVAELVKEVPFYQVRFLVKPGLTGWAQIHYDYGNSVEDALLKLQYDFYYIRYWSLWIDIYTIFKTVYVVLKFKGT